MAGGGREMMSSRTGDTYGVHFFHNKLFGPISGSKVVVHLLHAVGATYKRYLYLCRVACPERKYARRRSVLWTISEARRPALGHSRQRTMQ